MWREKRSASFSPPALPRLLLSIRRMRKARLASRPGRQECKENGVGRGWGNDDVCKEICYLKYTVYSTLEDICERYKMGVSSAVPRAKDRQQRCPIWLSPRSKSSKMLFACNRSPKDSATSSSKVLPRKLILRRQKLSIKASNNSAPVSGVDKTGQTHIDWKCRSDNSVRLV